MINPQSTHAVGLELALPRLTGPRPLGLTVGEVEVLRQVADGLRDREIAQRLGMSPRTVNSHLTAIYDKLGITSRSAATRFAIEHHLA